MGCKFGANCLIFVNNRLEDFVGFLHGFTHRVRFAWYKECVSNSLSRDLTTMAIDKGVY